MHRSASSLVSRIFSLAFGLFVVAFVGVAACGRSSLDEFISVDGGPPVDGSMDAPPDSGACNMTTCPNGCCDANGRCQAGTTTNQCGLGGQVCQDCQAEGFQFCDPN